MKTLLSILLVIPHCYGNYFNATESTLSEPTSSSNQKTFEQDATLKVDCGVKDISVIVPKLSVQSTSSSYVMFRKASTDMCQAIEVPGNAFLLTIKRNHKSTCGSVIKRSGSNRVSYTNEVVYLDVNNAKIISLLHFTCLYIGDHNVALLPDVYRKVITEGIEIQIRLFQDETFDDGSLLNKEFPTVSVERFIFAEIFLKSPTTKSSLFPSFVVEQCSASAFSEPGEAMHQLIQGGCAGPHDSTTEVLNNTSNSLLRFKFQMFKWVNITVQRIYIFCNVSSCKNVNSVTYANVRPNASCQFQKCSYNNTDASWRDRSKSIIVGAGPIFPSSSIFSRERPHVNTKDISSKNNNLNLLKDSSTVDPKIVHIVVGTISSACVVIIACAIYVLGRRGAFKNFFRKPSSKQTQEERIQPGFAFILQSSDDKPTHRNVDRAAKENQKPANASNRSSLNSRGVENVSFSPSDVR